MLVLVVGASACAVDPAPESAAIVRGDEERGAQPLEREAVAQLQRFQRDARGVRAHLLGRVALTELLAQPGGQAVWLRFGIGPDGEHAVFTAGPGEQAYNFTMPCPNSCPQGASGELLGSSAVALVPGSVEHVGGRIPANRARLLTSAYRGDPTDPVAGLRLERSAIERLLGNREVQGVWFASGRRSSGERSVVLLPADRNGELMQVPSRDAAEPARFVGELGGAPCGAADCPSW